MQNLVGCFDSRHLYQRNTENKFRWGDTSPEYIYEHFGESNES